MEWEGGLQRCQIRRLEGRWGGCWIVQDLWRFNGAQSKLGHLWSADGAQLLKVLYAGHMVPFDKPKEALIMLNAWLDATALEGWDTISRGICELLVHSDEWTWNGDRSAGWK